MASLRLPGMRPAWLLGVVACAALIAYVLFVQYAQHIEPCPLCIFQRVAFIAMGAVFLIGGLHAPRGGGRHVYTSLLILFALAGIGIAARHLWLQSLPPDQVPACGPGLGYMLDAFPIGETIRMVFTGSGECAETNWQFLGLAMPGWSLICFVVLAIWAVGTSRRRPRRLPGARL